MGVASVDDAYGSPHRRADRTPHPSPPTMTVLGTAAAVGLWLVAILGGYVLIASLVLFYLPPVDRLEYGPAADAAFVLTLPLVLATTWLAGLRRGA
ncbi:MAG: hypothetical protein U5J98_12000 [Halobacteriales archaeon]|nr:hypothetical protein [Halobacteriales archaeon]